MKYLTKTEITIDLVNFLLWLVNLVFFFTIGSWINLVTALLIMGLQVRTLQIQAETVRLRRSNARIENIYKKGMITPNEARQLYRCDK